MDRKNYGVEIAEKALKRYGDRVPDSVDFIEGIVDKINGVVTNNSHGRSIDKLSLYLLTYNNNHLHK